MAACGGGFRGKSIELDDVTFHQCVNLTQFDSEKTVSFVPPDGEFELMKYRISEGINLPFRVLPSWKDLGKTRFQVNVKVCTLTMLYLLICIAFPLTCLGRVRGADQECVWGEDVCSGSGGEDPGAQADSESHDSHHSREGQVLLCA